MIYRVSTGSVSSSQATTRPKARLTPAITMSRKENQRPRIFIGARSESQGSQQTLITAPQQELIPSRKIRVHSCSPAGEAGMIRGIRPKSSQSARLNMPSVSIYFLR